MAVKINTWVTSKVNPAINGFVTAIFTDPTDQEVLASVRFYDEELWIAKLSDLVVNNAV